MPACALACDSASKTKAQLRVWSWALALPQPLFSRQVRSPFQTREARAFPPKPSSSLRRERQTPHRKNRPRPMGCLSVRCRGSETTGPLYTALPQTQGDACRSTDRRLAEKSSRMATCRPFSERARTVSISIATSQTNRRMCMSTEKPSLLSSGCSRLDWRAILDLAQWSWVSYNP